MNDDLSDIRLFTKLVAAGSLSEAARRLNSSPPAMSRRLAAMESRLGVRLIDRTSRRFALTEEGGVLFERAVRILAELDDAEAEASTGGKTPRGHLRVCAPSQFGRRRIAVLIGAFVRQFPQVQVELVLSDAEPDFTADAFDIAFSVGLPNEPSLIARKLMPDRRVLICATPAYFAEHPAPQVPDDLAHHDCITLVRGRRVFDRWTFTEGGRRREIQVHGTLSSTSSEVVHGWVLAGLGLAARLRWDVLDEIEQGGLVPCLETFMHEERSLYIVYVSRSHLPPRVRAFIDYIVEHFRDP